MAKVISQLPSGGSVPKHNNLLGLNEGDYLHLTQSEKAKLDGIQSGAEVNVNTDWNAISGDAQILNKPTSFPPSTHTHTISEVINLQNELNSKENISNKVNTISGNSSTEYPTEKAVVDYVSSQIGADFAKVVYFDNVTPNVASIFDLNNPPLVNDPSLKEDVANLYIGTDASTWVYITSPAGYVTKTVTSSGSNFYITGTSTDAGSIKTGSITKKGQFVIDSEVVNDSGLTLKKTESSILKTDSLGKVVKTTNLQDVEYAPIVHTHTVSQITDFPTFKTIENQSIIGAGNIDLDKASVGLGNVDNTSDLNKIISTATQTALNAKANISGQVFTGAVSATNLSGTNTGDNAPNSLYSGLVTNATHTGEVTGSTALTITNGAVTNAKLANVATSTLKGRVAAATGVVEDLTASQVRTLLNVANGANNYVHPANHLASIITQDASNRFVTDTEKSAWNAKESAIASGTISQYWRGDKTWQEFPTIQTIDNIPTDGSNNAVSSNGVFDALATKAPISSVHNPVTLGTANGLSLSTQQLSLGLASSGVTGALSGTDWNTFNNKQDALGYTPENEANKQNSLAADGTNTFYPTVTAVNMGLATKASSFSVASKGLLIGDSTIAAGGAGLLGIDSYLLEPADVANGSTVYNQAVWGASINDQLTTYLANANKSTYDFIIVQLGLNDINLTDNISIAIGRYQNLINQINSTKKSTAKVIVSAMIPAKKWWIVNYGTTDGNTLHVKWQSLNDAIMGGGATPISGVNFRNDSHVNALSNGDGYLSGIYDSGDGLHENNLGREVLAASFRKTLALSLNFSVKLNNKFSEYFNNLGSDVYLKGGRFRINSPLGQGGESIVITNPINGFNQYSQISYQIENDAKTAKQAFNTGVGNYLNGTQLAEKYFVYWSDMVSSFYSIYEIDKLGNSITRGDSKAKTFSLDNTIFSESSNNGVFNFSSAYKGLFLNSPSGGSNITFQGAGLDYGFISGELESTNNGQVIIRTRRSGTMANAVVISSLGDLNIIGKLKAALTIYANDAAADADSTLLSGQFYKLTGSRVVYQKP